MGYNSSNWPMNGNAQWMYMITPVPGRFELGGEPRSPVHALQRDEEEFDKVSGCWTNTLLDGNTPNVHASSRLFASIGAGYCPEFEYFEKQLQPDQETAVKWHIGCRMSRVKCHYDKMVKGGRVPPRGYGLGELLRQEQFATRIFVGRGGKPDSWAY